jgi:hypothetical protein
MDAAAFERPRPVLKAEIRSHRLYKTKKFLDKSAVNP